MEELNIGDLVNMKQLKNWVPERFTSISVSFCGMGDHSKRQ
jgi:hypothetical protein